MVKNMLDFSPECALRKVEIRHEFCVARNDIPQRIIRTPKFPDFGSNVGRRWSPCSDSQTKRETLPTDSGKSLSSVIASERWSSSPCSAGVSRPSERSNLPWSRGLLPFDFAQD